uniref:Putative ribonuclease H-like domain-containing protein n=1 Tax=Tanacetum cinerariifolium TaxID=118510 RepID=A0A6L2MQU0_TANCI|nr:putative ribonuclease H-like domain-containing protein [Tanacetum cinerariifolium]
MKDIAIKELRRKLKVAQKEKDGIQLTVDKLENVSRGLNKLIECQIVNNCKKGLGYESYNAVPPLYIGNFMPPKPDLSFTGLDEFANKPVAENTKSNKEETKAVRKNSDAPIIKEWVSDNEEEIVSQPKIEKKIVRPNIVKKECAKPRQQEKTTRETVKKVEHNRQNTHRPRGNQRNWNKMMSQKLRMNAARQMSYISKTAHLIVKWPILKNTAFKNSNVNQRVNTISSKTVNTARPKAVVNAVKGNHVNAVKASACWVWKPKIKVIYHVSKHNSAPITLKKFYYIDAQDYEEIDRGYVSFGGNLKGRKITRKGTIKTGKLDFENVYFVRELKFNLFSVSQMYDKKNNVLFNDTKCIVLSPNFKLIDESQVLLRVPRKNNMYSVDLKNIVPKGGLTFLFAKATSDESKIWHRRLGHLNFKTMNKLVKGNLIRGLPSKLFENDQTCVACQKGKQHRSSCKTKTENLISLPLHLLNMDLFGPTFVKSLVKKMYCLGVIDDYSRFTWVFFLDHLGKFDGKAAEGLLIGYLLNSKAFRVFNIRKRIVEENLHIRFSESTPNVVGSGPDWLFNIDALTRTMNYEPIVAGTRSNGFAVHDGNPQLSYWWKGRVMNPTGEMM